ncbi:MAG: glucose-6-phosphate dehydrogenase [Gemmataceae bacterium]
MTHSQHLIGTLGEQPQAHPAPHEPCVLVIFGASGDLTKRLLMPAVYNLACERLLPAQFAIVGVALDELATDDFRARMSQDMRQFTTRRVFDAAAWERFVPCLHYVPGRFENPQTYANLAQSIAEIEKAGNFQSNVIFYMATPPAVFGLISSQLESAGFNRGPGWRRLIIEKPFGHDYASAVALNQEILKYWREDQIYRIDHYLGKETVQNILAFRFSNRIFEPIWNKNQVDHLQLTVTETVGVEGRGNYYDRSGVLRDMMQNHMFQMLAYVSMEPPVSFRADAIRDEKQKLLEAIRIPRPEEVPVLSARGQYGPGQHLDGAPAAGYRQEPHVNPQSNTETYAALKLFIDNWRWEGVPVYLRSGKSLWKKGTEIVVQFKKAPEVVFRETPGEGLDPNRLIFHIQPDQGIELRFHAKIPGPAMRLQKVNMRFAYDDAFRAARGTGYEVLLYSCMMGDATLFSRTDFVETAWRIAQPILDYWSAQPATDFPNYRAGSWGPKAAFELIERDGRRWYEVINSEALAKIPLFQGCDPLLLNSVVMQLQPVVCDAGDMIIRKGETGKDMYILLRGKVEVLDGAGQVLNTLRDGDFFGEIALLLSRPRTASIRALTPCELFMLEKDNFANLLRDHPDFTQTILRIAQERYQVTLSAEQLVPRKEEAEG